MKQFCFTTLLLITIISSNAFAQVKAKKPSSGKSEVLTDAAIINLHKAGLDDDVIISKIETSPANFDLSTDRLIELKNAGVSSAVIKALMNKSSGEKADDAKTPAHETSTNTLVSLTNLNAPYYFNKQQNKYEPTEKMIASVRIRKKLLGYGGVSSVYEVNGSRSTIRIAAQEDNAFFINTGGNPLPEMVLYKLKIVGDKRDAASMEVSAFSGIKQSNNVVSYNTTIVKPGIYKVSAGERLPPGEYFFAGKPVVSATTIDVYAFGID